MFVDSIKQFASSLEFLFYTWDENLLSDQDLAILTEQQSEYWGRKVEVSILPRALRKETNWSQYVASSFDIKNHSHFYRFANSAAIKATSNALERKPDFIHVFTLAAMMPLMAIKRPLPPVFLDLDDVEHKSRFRRSIEPPWRLGKLLSTTQAMAIHAGERKANRLATRTIVCSSKDADYLKLLRFKDVQVVPNTAPAVPENVDLPTAPTLGFIGNFWHPPNVSAVERLVTKIWPLIKQRVPDAELLIAGQPLHAVPSSGLNIGGVTFLGYVNELSEFYRSVRVICCPMMAGGGTRVKLVEAAQFGRPIVSTRVGAEGLDLAPETEVLIRKLDAAFADACADLLQDWSAAKRLGDAARSRAEASYDGAVIRGRITTMIAQALGVETPPVPASVPADR